LVGALKRALAEHGHRTSTVLADAAVRTARAGNFEISGYGPVLTTEKLDGVTAGDHVSAQVGSGEAELGSLMSLPPGGRGYGGASGLTEKADHPLGAARAQLHGNFIVAETAAGLVLVDQHAAHERIIYERLKQQYRTGNVVGQALLVPEIIDLDAADCALLLEHERALRDLGLVLEPFGPGAVLVREVPALLGTGAIAPILRDLCGDLEELGEAISLQHAIDKVAGVMACHGSVRAGRHLTLQEMDELLRTMERDPHTGQCIHGRPTYIELKLSDIERLFARR
jgi:DNA mismatch repair protein MutL